MRTSTHAPVTAGNGRTPIAIYAISAAALVMSIALFLHPMSPADFMELALTDPLASLLEQGAPMAAVFWCALAVSLGAVFVLLRSLNLPRVHLRPLH